MQNESFVHIITLNILLKLSDFSVTSPKTIEKRPKHYFWRYQILVYKFCRLRLLLNSLILINFCLPNLFFFFFVTLSFVYYIAKKHLDANFIGKL